MTNLFVRLKLCLTNKMLQHQTMQHKRVLHELIKFLLNVKYAQPEHKKEPNIKERDPHISNRLESLPFNFLHRVKKKYIYNILNNVSYLPGLPCVLRCAVDTAPLLFAAVAAVNSPARCGKC